MLVEEGWTHTRCLTVQATRANELWDAVYNALEQKKPVNGRPKYAIWCNSRIPYYETLENPFGGFQRVRRFRVPDILIRQNQRADRGHFKSGARKLMLLQRDAALTLGQIRKVADCGKDLKAYALVLSPGTAVSQTAEIEASVLGVNNVGLIRNHGCQQRLENDIHSFVNLHLDW